MKLGQLCPAPCIPGASAFEIPPPGCSKSQLRFGTSEGRDYYSLLLRNHDVLGGGNLDPRLAVVGLSPAGTQIDEFVETYRRTGDYAEAAIQGAFAGLSLEIISMMNGLGLSSKLGLQLNENAGFARHADIYVTSLVACATLTTTGSSTDFDPSVYASARRCMAERFVAEILNPAFTRLSHVVILGSKGWAATKKVLAPSGTTVLDTLRAGGKLVVNLPHPSDANREYVNLASLPRNKVPPLLTYVEAKWAEYRLRPAKRGKVKQSEMQYKERRRTVWRSIEKLRDDIKNMEAA
jgi:uracil-DNA glycosylase